MTRSPLRTLRILLLAIAPGLIATAAEPAARLLVRDGLVLTMKPGEETPFVGYVVVGHDGKIHTVGHGKAPVDLTAHTVVDARGKFICPIFVCGPRVRSQAKTWKQPQRRRRGKEAEEMVVGRWQLDRRRTILECGGGAQRRRRNRDCGSEIMSLWSAGFHPRPIFVCGPA